MTIVWQWIRWENEAKIWLDSFEGLQKWNPGYNMEILQQYIDFQTLAERTFPEMFTTALRTHPCKSALSPSVRTLDMTLFNAPLIPFFFLSGLLFILSSDSYIWVYIWLIISITFKDSSWNLVYWNLLILWPSHQDHIYYFTHFTYEYFMQTTSVTFPTLQSLW